MKSPPLASIVIPAFDAEEFIERTLHSALNQTHTTLEVIVVDDGSTDSTKQLAQAIAAGDPRVRIISVANGGVAKARNIGIEAASGEFVAFLDADDLWHPTKVERQIAALTTNGGASAAATYSQMRIIDEDDRVTRNGSGVGCSGFILCRHLFARPVGNGSSMLVRRETALEVDGFDPNWAARGVGGCEDLDFELKIASKYPIIALRQYLVGYRSHPGNMSSNGLALARAVLATVEHHLQLHPELPVWAVRKVRASTLEYALHNIAADQEWKLFLSELARLHQIDLGRGIEYAARFSARKLVRDLLAIRTSSPEYSSRPFFYDLNPALAADLSIRAVRPRDTRIVDQLGVVDAAWAEQMGLTHAAAELTTSTVPPVA